MSLGEVVRFTFRGVGNLVNENKNATSSKEEWEIDKRRMGDQSNCAMVLAGAIIIYLQPFYDLQLYLTGMRVTMNSLAINLR